MGFLRSLRSLAAPRQNDFPGLQRGVRQVNWDLNRHWNGTSDRRPKGFLRADSQPIDGLNENSRQTLGIRRDALHPPDGGTLPRKKAFTNSARCGLNKNRSISFIGQQEA